jgi:hypothetical protein
LKAIEAHVPLDDWARTVAEGQQPRPLAVNHLCVRVGGNGQGG